jgi:hypothetical protein
VETNVRPNRRIRETSPGSVVMHGSNHTRLWIRVFGTPILLAIGTVLGLLAALLWGEIGRYVVWATVGAPVLVVLWVCCAAAPEKQVRRRELRGG